MKLSSDLVSQFVKITNDEPRKTPNTTAYGQIVTFEDTQYVQLDGSDLLTPFDSSVTVKDEERVIVSIKGHGAIITGNLSDPSASTDDLINLSNDLVEFKINTEGMFFEVNNSIGNLNTKLEVTAEAIRVELSDSAKELTNKIEVTAGAIRGELSDAENELNNKIEITAGAIRTEMTDDYNELTNKIEITAEGIYNDITDEVAGLNTKIETTASGIRTTMTDNYNNLNTKIETTASGITTTVTDNYNKLNTKIDTTAAGINATVSSNYDSLYSKIEVTASGIRSEVSNKCDANQVATVVQHNAESWGISIHGKLGGSTYWFDGSNFTIGGEGGSTGAYHNRDHSRWTHNDGSFTKVSWDGLERFVGSTGYRYHYLQYAGEYICNSEEQVGIWLPGEFAGKDFKVITAVKRIYVALLDYIENARFPLLSFYAEARNVNHGSGYFEIYASIRAWNRTGVSGMGTVVGTNDTANETAAVKPVVAYWVYA